MKRRHMTPARLIALGFLAIILVGTGLLMLPVASKGAPAGFLDALFTSTSATCVTGLIVRDTFTGWTLFGQLVILSLIQVGGLGLMTMFTLLSFALGKHLGLYNRKVLMQSAGTISLNGIGRLIRRIIPFSFVFELLGAALLAIRFVPQFGWVRGCWFSLFHAVSAFCNAGFDLMGVRAPFSSLTAYCNDPLVSLTVCALIVVGGLGFLVWRDIAVNGLRFSKYQLHTKLVLTTTGILLLGGWILFFFFERDASMAGMTVPQRLLASFFQSVTTRTAGFNTVDLTKLSESGNLLSDLLMLVGGSPGSTAGGIKTTTLAILLLALRAAFTSDHQVHCFGRRIPAQVITRTLVVSVLYGTLFLVASMALIQLEPVTMEEALFECASAIGTVGLTLGITPELGAVSKGILILLMYLGRVGGLTLVYAVSGTGKRLHYTLPEESIGIG